MTNLAEPLIPEQPLNDFIARWENAGGTEKSNYQLGQVRELHDAPDLDRAVFDACGRSDLAERLVGKPGATTPLPDKPADQAEAEEELLMRLVDLNTQCAAEEAQGHIRWLRPDYQAPEAQPAGTQTAAALDTGAEEAAPTPIAAGKQTWPKTIPEQVQIVHALLEKGPQTLDSIADHFKRKPAKAVAQVLAALEVLGQARQAEEGMWQVV